MSDLIKHIVSLHPEEEKLLIELKGSGFRTSEVFRMGLRMLYRKEFPIYSKPKEEARPLTQKEREAKCEAEGGEVIEEEGIKKCAFVEGALTRKIII